MNESVTVSCCCSELLLNSWLEDLLEDWLEGVEFFLERDALSLVLLPLPAGCLLPFLLGCVVEEEEVVVEEIG